MIIALMIINNFGKPRLCKFYRQTVRTWGADPDSVASMPSPVLSHPCAPSTCLSQMEARQQQIIREAFQALTTRQESASSIVDAAAWFGPGTRIVYRLYATLHFCFAIDECESELGILDLIQVLVETLDRHFKSVCELDIIFSCERAHWIVDEMIVGGLVAETSPSAIIEAIEAQAKLERSQSDLGSAAAVAQQKLDALAGTISALPRPAAFGGGS